MVTGVVVTGGTAGIDADRPIAGQVGEFQRARTSLVYPGLSDTLKESERSPGSRRSRR